MANEKLDQITYFLPDHLTKSTDFPYCLAHLNRDQAASLFISSGFTVFTELNTSTLLAGNEHTTFSLEFDPDGFSQCIHIEPGNVIDKSPLSPSNLQSLINHLTVDSPAPPIIPLHLISDIHFQMDQLETLLPKLGYDIEPNPILFPPHPNGKSPKPRRLNASVGELKVTAWSVDPNSPCCIYVSLADGTEKQCFQDEYKRQQEKAFDQNLTDCLKPDNLYFWLATRVAKADENQITVPAYLATGPLGPLKDWPWKTDEEFVHKAQEADGTYRKIWSSAGGDQDKKMIAMLEKWPNHQDRRFQLVAIFDKDGCRLHLELTPEQRSRLNKERQRLMMRAITGAVDQVGIDKITLNLDALTASEDLQTSIQKHYDPAQTNRILRMIAAEEPFPPEVKGIINPEGPSQILHTANGLIWRYLPPKHDSRKGCLEIWRKKKPSISAPTIVVFERPGID